MEDPHEYATIVALCREREVELKLWLVEQLGYIRGGQWAEHLPSDGATG